MNSNNELTLLSKEELAACNIYYNFEYSIRTVPITDLGILTGGSYDWTNNNLKERECGFWIRNIGNTRGTTSVCMDRGLPYCVYSDLSYYTIRPALRCTPDFFEQISTEIQTGIEVEYGEYPQDAPAKDIQQALEQIFETGLLKTTGKTYTFEKPLYGTYRPDFQPIIYEEYEYLGKRYIRVPLNNNANLVESFTLSNGEVYNNGDNVWVEVSPVVWYIDDRTRTLIAKRGLLSGVRFDLHPKGYNGDFSTTNMNEYLNKYMLRDLTQNPTFNYADDKAKVYKINK